MREVLMSLFDRRGRAKLVAMTLGMVVVSGADMVAVIMVAPLMTVLMGGDMNSGLLKVVGGSLGEVSPDRLAVTLLVAILGAFIVKDVFTVYFNWWQSGFVNREMARTQTRLVDFYVHMPWVQYTRRNDADFLNRLQNVERVYGGVTAVMTLVSQGITVAAILIALLVVSPVVTLVIIAYSVIVGLLFLRISKPIMRKTGKERIDANLQQYAISLRVFGGAKEVRVRNSQEYFVNTYGRATVTMALANRLGAFVLGLPKYVLEIVFMGGLGLILIVAGLLGATSALLGTLAVVVVAAFRMLPSLAGVMGAVNGVRAALPSVEVVMEDFRAMEASEDGARPSLTGIEKLPFRKVLAVSNVSFQYEPDLPYVLDHVSFDVPHGTSVGIVGSSGAGKSTLVDMLLGLLTPSSGAVTCDGVDISGCLPGWQKNVAMVPQSVYLMDATVRENIAFDQADEDIDDELIAEVLAQSQLTETVEGLEQGWDTRIGEHGVRLSGGQRQRIGIARALYRRPEVLVLDEATSALDNETERRITETIEGLHGSVTMIIVAHRLSTVKNADKIVFLSRGRVASEGSFDEVTAANPEFARLVELGSLESAQA